MAVFAMSTDLRRFIKGGMEIRAERLEIDVALSIRQFETPINPQ
jgi:hypothetical protein